MEAKVTDVIAEIAGGAEMAAMFTLGIEYGAGRIDSWAEEMGQVALHTVQCMFALTGVAPGTDIPSFPADPEHEKSVQYAESSIDTAIHDPDILVDYFIDAHSNLTDEGCTDMTWVMVDNLGRLFNAVVQVSVAGDDD